MSKQPRPIDDPEVRAQHRRQAGRRALDCFRAPFSVALFFFVMIAGAVSCDGAFGTRVPATVELVDASKSSVRVVSSDPEISGWYDVDDTGSYARGDRVGVVLTGEDNTPTDLDREPVLRRVLGLALLFGSLAAIVTALRMPRLALRTSRRRRALAEPWRPVRATCIDGRLVALSGAQGSAHWRVEELPADFPTQGTFDAQIAGTERRLVIRFFGSTHLVSARRTRQATGESAMSAPRCTSVGVSDPRSSSSCLASRK